ncbi:MAG: YceI family protein [Oligoflexia bacterium]|nr:YceI family protein [Oligoflexia bacterium]
MKSLIIILSLLFSLSTLAKKSVNVVVGLSPAGSFEINSSKVKGKAVYKGGQYTAKKVKVSVKSLKTGMDLRDKHLKDKLEMKKHPYIVIDKAVAKGGKGSAIVNIKGMKKKVPFSYKINGKYFVAKFPLKLSDYKFKGINYMGVGVKDKVVITASLPIVK